MANRPFWPGEIIEVDLDAVADDIRAAVMPISLANARDLLLPGLRAGEGCPDLVATTAPYFDQVTSTCMWPTGVGWAITREAIDDNLYRQVLGGRNSYPRIDGETAARSRERARGLLKSLLTPEQWAEFEASRKVTECIDDREFELTPGGTIAVKRRETKRLFRREQPKLIERWCINPQSDDYLPVEDQLIGQLLHLRAGPDKLRKQANVFPVS